MKRPLCKFYSCFLLNALIAATKNTTDKTTEMIKGTVNSVMEIFPEIRQEVSNPIVTAVVILPVSVSV